jgi:hypothetical protein
MNKYLIRFNKTRGQPSRGTLDHAWRVFEGEKEYLVKNFEINVPSFSEKDKISEDWNLACEGYLTFDRKTSTAIINSEKSI